MNDGTNDTSAADDNRPESEATPEQETPAPGVPETDPGAGAVGGGSESAAAGEDGGVAASPEAAAAPIPDLADTGLTGDDFAGDSPDVELEGAIKDLMPSPLAVIADRALGDLNGISGDVHELSGDLESAATNAYDCAERLTDSVALMFLGLPMSAQRAIKAVLYAQTAGASEEKVAEIARGQSPPAHVDDAYMALTMRAAARAVEAITREIAVDAMDDGEDDQDGNKPVLEPV